MDVGAARLLLAFFLSNTASTTRRRWFFMPNSLDVVVDGTAQNLSCGSNLGRKDKKKKAE